MDIRQQVEEAFKLASKAFIENDCEGTLREMEKKFLAKVCTPAQMNDWFDFHPELDERVEELQNEMTAEEEGEFDFWLETRASTYEAVEAAYEDIESISRLPAFLQPIVKEHLRINKIRALGSDYDAIAQSQESGLADDFWDRG